MRHNIVIVVAAVATLLVLVAIAAFPAPARAQTAEEAGPAKSTSESEPAKSEPEPAAAPAPGAPAPSSGASASQPKPATEEQVSALAEEVRRLKLELGIGNVEGGSYGGLGPAASKVYFSQKGLSIGGYGEINYRRDVRGDTAETDVYRVVAYLGYRFTPHIVFNTEIEFEHGGDEVGIEFAYLDFLLADPVNVRVGNVLVPIGFLNRMHEPAFFNGVFRPQVERSLIPTTWHENGVGLHGEVAGLRYETYFLVGLDSTSTDGGEARLSADSWLRGARTGGAEALANSFAGVLNLSYDLGPLTVAGTIYGGRSGQGKVAPGGEKIEGDVLLGEAHARLVWRGLEARALWTVGTLGQADLVSEAQGITDPAQYLGSRVQGGYVELAYDVLSLLWPDGGQALVPFARYEMIDLHEEVPPGGERNPALDQDLWTVGVGYRPIPNVVLKADYQWTQDAAGAVGQYVNLGVGLVF
jgi:hypothetical protein